MAIVYRHISLDTNDVFYIGIGKTEKRAYKGTSYRSKFWNNIAKNGYRVEIIFDNLSWEDACKKEKEFISLYGRRDLEVGTLVNMTDGGDGGFGVIVKEETKEKIRKYQLSLDKKRKPGRIQSDEIKLKIKNTLTGRKRPINVIEKLKKPKTNKKNYSYAKEKIECPYCKMMAQPALAYRWHFNNCKQK